jgi:hypothetical protein
MKKILNEGNRLYNIISSSGFRNVTNYGSDSDFLTSYGSSSVSQKVTVPTIPVPVPQHYLEARVSLPLHSVLSCLDEAVLAPNARLQLLNHYNSPLRK